MHAESRFITFIVLITISGMMLSCGGDGGTSPTPPPQPTMTLLSHPPDSIHYTDSADFAWQVNNAPGAVLSYYAGLDGIYNSTTDTSSSYSGFTEGNTHTFGIFAEFSGNVYTDTASWTFSIYGNRAPSVDIVSGPADSVLSFDTVEFSWQGTDPDGNLEGYHAGLDGELSWTIDTTLTYDGGLPQSTALTFQVVAQDSDGALSDTAEWIFATFTILTASGAGINDDDGDGFWSEYGIIWTPINRSSSTLDVRLIAAVTPTYGTGTEWVDSTASLINLNPEESVTDTFLLSGFNKDLYDVRLELHGSDGSLLADLPYGSVTSLTQVGLEPLEGFFAWFDDAWTVNAVDTLDPVGYYESIDLWFDVDATLSPDQVKVNIFERNSSNVEIFLAQSTPFEVEGLGDEDALGWRITAVVTTPDVFDYRLVLLSHPEGDFLHEFDYGDDPDLMDIPLCAGTGADGSDPRVEFLR